MFVYEWFKNLQFFNGYVLNIARLINFKKYKLYIIKSHDSNIFMEHSFHLIIGIYFKKDMKYSDRD